MLNTGLYNPLSEILLNDNFDNGLSGWIVLNPNFRQDAMEYFPTLQGYADWGPPMLSSATFSYAGTHGALTGTYSMKIGTKPVAGKVTEGPVPGSMGHAIKRITYRKRQLLKCEAWYTFKAEQDRPGIGENDIRAFGFMWDIQDDEKRYFCGARYMNAADGKMQRRWQYISASEGTDEEWGDLGPSAVGHEVNDTSKTPKVYLRRGVDPQWRGKRYSDGSGDSYKDVPNGYQELCYNETADKINWHYFSLTVDLAQREYVELGSVNQVYDLRGCKATAVEAYPRINYLLNPVFWIEADTNRRVFLYVDSVVISTGKGE